MKKLHIALLVASFIVPSISFASIDTNLKYGSRGVAVTELQDFLIAKGFLSGQTSGNFFSLTRKAVVAYQASVGLPATGYVGPMTRSKINDDLSTANAPAVSAEITETGTTTLTQATPSTSFISGCSSTIGFSTTTGTACSGVTTHATPTANRTMTLQNGSVVEVDANGSITRFISSVVTTPSAQSTAPTTTTSAENTSTLSISVGQTTSTTTSAYLSWSTSIPTNSKIFLTQTPVDLYANSTQIISSASGYSTQHFVNIPNLIPSTQYSYTIEAINGTQDKKMTGIINTNPLPTITPIQDVCLTSSPTITITPWTIQNNTYLGNMGSVVVSNSSTSMFAPRENFVTYAPWRNAQPSSSDELYLKVNVTPENCQWSVRTGTGNSNGAESGQGGDYFGINLYNMPTASTIDWATVENLGVINQGDINFTIVGKSGSYSTSTPVTVKLRIQ